MDARRILPPRSTGSRAQPTPYPSNKPGLAASVPSPHHRSHQPASTLPSPQRLGHSIYQPTPGPSRRHSFTTSITYGADAGTDGGFLSPPSLSPLLIYLQNLPRVNTTGYQAERLHDIVCDASNSSKSTIFKRLSRYLRDVFPPGSPHHQPAAATRQQQQTRRQARRREYATTQRHWRSNRMRCIKNILGDSRMPSSHLEPRWSLTGQ